MADNVTLDAGSGGSAIRTDDDGTAHWQYVKLAYGADNTQTIVTSTTTNPLPVALSDTDNAVLDTIDSVLDTISGNITACNTGAVVLSSGTVTTVSTVTNLAQMGGVAISLNTGVRDTGTQRVSVCTDDVVVVNLAGNNDVTCTLDAETTKVIGTVRVASAGIASGSIASGAVASGAIASGAIASGAIAAGAVVDLPLPSGASTSANQLPATSGGISTVYRDEDIDETAVSIKASAGQVYWIHVVNLDATPVYLHLWDVAVGGVTVGTTAELCSFCVPSQGDANGAGFTMTFPHGIEFGTEISVACTTTIGGTSGPGTNEVLLNIGYE